MYNVSFYNAPVSTSEYFTKVKPPCAFTAVFTEDDDDDFTPPQQQNF